MSQYTYRDLWDKDKLEAQERQEKQQAKAEKDLLEGMTVIDGINSEFWKVLSKGFIEPKLRGDRIDTAKPEDLLAIQLERRVLREMLQFLEEKAKAGNRAGRFLKARKENSSH